MKRKFGFILSLMFFCAPALAQQDTNEVIILDRQDQIQRLLLTDNLDSIKLNDLLSFNANAVVALAEEEQLLLVTCQYRKLLNLIVANTKFEKKSKRTRIFRYKSDELKFKHKYSKVYHPLYTIIGKYILDNKSNILRNIHSAALSDEERSFLIAYSLLHILKEDYCDVELENDMLVASRFFQNKYPNSIFQSYNEKYIDQEYIESSWGTGAYLVSGQFVSTGELKNSLPNAVPITWGLTMNRNRFFIFAGFGSTAGAIIKQDFEYQKKWNKGDKVEFIHGELLLGYNILDSKKFGLTPMVGLWGTRLNPKMSNEENDYYNDVSPIRSKIHLKYGVNLDYRWGRTSCKNTATYGRGSGKDYTYFIVRLSTGYSNPRFEKSVSTLDGSMWHFNLGIAYQYQFKRKVK